jgi:FkbM family methyltransferase
MGIALPRSGAAAQIFYRRHSDASIVRVMEEFLRDGMVVLDIGAHVGEYTLIAAKVVGPRGKVHAIEPQPSCAEIVSRNAKLNRLENVTVYRCAVSNEDGETPFHIDRISMGGFVAAQEDNASHLVPCVTVDTIMEDSGLSEVHLLKIDAAGNERAVLQGGAFLFTGAKPPMVICKFYHPGIVRERHGYDAKDIIDTLLNWNYQLFGLVKDNRVPIDSSDKVMQFFGQHTYCVPLLGIRKVG